jgi:hypothetical protein
MGHPIRPENHPYQWQELQSQAESLANSGCRQKPRANDPPWIDAICINQGSSRVQSPSQTMCNIYTKARQVLVWLGPGTDALTVFANYLALSHRCGHSLPHEFDNDIMKAMAADNIDKATVLSGFQKLCDNASWTRTWIAQEFILARQLLLMIGPRSIPLEKFSQFLNSASRGLRTWWPPPQHAALVVTSLLKARVYGLCQNRRISVGDSPGRSLETLLDLLGESECEDPRDQIFALLGLAQGCMEFEINYAIDKYALFKSALGFLVQGGSRPISMSLACKLMRIMKSRPHRCLETQDSQSRLHSGCLRARRRSCLTTPSPCLGVRVSEESARPVLRILL